MGLGTGATAAIVGGIGAAGSVASGLIGANAAGHAADTQAAAANNAAALERQSAVDALNFNKLQYGNSLSLLSPFYNTGVSANSRLAYLMGLNPARGLPAGVVNPNATNSTASVPRLGGAFDPSNIGGDQVLPVGTGANTPGGVDITANRFAAFAPGMRFGGATGTGVDPNAQPGGPAMTGTGQVVPNGQTGVITASTNQGGTAQVPRTDGGTANGGTPFSNLPDLTNFGTASGPNSFGSLAQGWNQTFSSPANLTDDPGYNFRLKLGQQAVENSAAARGGLLSGGTVKALDDYTQGSASQEYQNSYNRALQNYNTNYNTFTNDQTNEFNRLMALQQGGQVSANNLSASGITAANNAANISLTSAGQIGQQLNNAGAATASGYIGGANAITGAIGNGVNSLSTLALMQALKQQAPA